MHSVLVIQDRSTLGASACPVLEEMGLVVYCETPLQFAKAGRWTEPVDLLVVDLEAEEMPPNMRGWGILEMFRELNHTGAEPDIVVMTHFNDAPSRLLGNIHAVSAYLLKPVRTEIFVSTVSRLLGLENTPTIREG